MLSPNEPLFQKTCINDFKYVQGANKTISICSGETSTPFNNVSLGILLHLLLLEALPLVFPWVTTANHPPSLPSSIINVYLILVSWCLLNCIVPNHENSESSNPRQLLPTVLTCTVGKLGKEKRDVQMCKPAPCSPPWGQNLWTSRSSHRGGPGSHHRAQPNQAAGSLPPPCPL